jgi:hypothetical protein
MLHGFFLPRDMTTKPQSGLPNAAVSLLGYSIAQANDRVNAPGQKSSEKTDLSSKVR